MRHLLRYPLLVLLAWLAHLFAGHASAGLVERVVIGWDAPKPAENVSLTHLRQRLPDGGTVYLAASSNQTAAVDLPPGTYLIVATAMNAHGWGAFSEPLTVVVEEPLLPLPPEEEPPSPVLPPLRSIRVVEHLVSVDGLTDWCPTSYVVLPEPGHPLIPAADKVFQKSRIITIPLPP